MRTDKGNVPKDRKSAKEMKIVGYSPTPNGTTVKARFDGESSAKFGPSCTLMRSMCKTTRIYPNELSWR